MGGLSDRPSDRPEGGLFGGAAAAGPAAPEADVEEDRESILKSTAFRWIRPLGARAPVDAHVALTGRLEEDLDAFMDRHLPWLPVPRYGPDAVPTHGVTDDDVIACLIQLSELLRPADDADLEHLKSLYDCEAAALELMPLIDALRAPDTTTEASAVLCILLALDAKTAASVSSATASGPDFVPKALKLIGSELGQKVSSTVEALKAAHEYLHRKALQVACSGLPKAEATWPSLADAEAKYYLPHKSSIEATLKQHSEETGLSVEYLRQRCRIQSLVAEDLSIGFLLN
jgi:hypothetical protein